MGVLNRGQRFLMTSLCQDINYKIKIKAVTKHKLCCRAASEHTHSSVRRTFSEGVDAAGHRNLIGNQEEVNCFRPMRLYINMQCLRERLDVCLITVLVVVCVWLSGRVVTRSDRLGTAERVRPTAQVVSSTCKACVNRDMHRVVEVHVCRAYTFTCVRVCVRGEGF